MLDGKFKSRKDLLPRMIVECIAKGSKEPLQIFSVGLKMRMYSGEYFKMLFLLLNCISAVECMAALRVAYKGSAASPIGPTDREYRNIATR
jgi:hypothetical protein